MKKLKTPTNSKAMAWLCGLLCSSSYMIFSVLLLSIREILGVRALVALRAFFIPNFELITSSELRVPNSKLRKNTPICITITL